MNWAKRREQGIVARGAEAGFTLLEMVMAITISALVFTTSAYVMYGSIKAYSAARQRSVFIEIANGAMEELRGQPFEQLGVASGNLATYNDPSAGQFEGLAATVVGGTPLPATSTVSSSPITGIQLPYYIDRWVTWVGPNGAPGNDLKRIAVRVRWTESSGAARSYRLTSTRYPGGLGSAANTNIAPVSSIAITSGSASGNVGHTVTFSAAASTDADGDALQYAWDFGDGQTLTASPSSIVTHQYNLAGTFVTRVTVTDGNGGSTSSPMSITTIDPSSAPPTASFVVQSNLPTGVVTLDASGSTDTDGTVTGYSWTFGDGSVGSGAQVNHTYTASGTYTVGLIVTDNSAKSSPNVSQSVTVTVATCQASSGSFVNGANTNFALVASNRKPSNATFTFDATTNTVCTSAVGRMTQDGGTFEVPLTLQTTAGGVKTWRATSSIGTAAKLPTGCAQTGSIVAKDASAVTSTKNFTYKVATTLGTCP